MEINIKHTRLIKDDVVAEIQDLEAKYGVPTERLHEAFYDAEGVLYETPDYLHWLWLKRLLEMMK